MSLLRFIVTALPQILLLLVLGGWLDLLGGWNHTDSAFAVLTLLFISGPATTFSLLIIETLRYWKKQKRKSDRTSRLWLVIAIVLVAEAVAIDLFLLSQLTMH